jgi:hypothetical protein
MFKAGQKVPDFIEQDATGGGDYETGGFGGQDFRKVHTILRLILGRYFSLVFN